MKWLLIISIIIAVLSGKITAGGERKCIHLIDEPLTLCETEKVLTIIPQEPELYRDQDEEDIIFKSIADLPHMRPETLFISPGYHQVTMNLKPELFEKIDADNLIVERVNFSTPRNPFRSVRSVTDLGWLENSYENASLDIFGDFMILNKLLWRDPNLQTISPTLFAKINDQLRHLGIMGPITDIKPQSFAAFTRLIDLKLFSGNLTHLRPDMFSGLYNLRDLGLKACGIKSIDANTFHGLPLISLDLGGNQIRNIDPTIFHSMPSLQKIFLHHNKLQTIPREAFRDNGRLVKLILNNNDIRVIQSRTFQNLGNLRKLDLGNNRINSVEPYSFTNSSVSELSLHNNVITFLDNSMFRGLRLRKSLDLSLNFIHSIHSQAFKTIRVDKGATVTLNIENMDRFRNVLPYNWNFYGEPPKVRNIGRRLRLNPIVY